MLILNRQIGEKIIIGDRAVELSIEGVRGKQVILGIHADRAIPVYREEVFDQVKAQGRFVPCVDLSAVR